MIRYPRLTQRVGFRNLLLILAIGMFVIASLTTSGFAQLPDFQVDADSISFSNPTPVEGEEITISVEVKNIGGGTQTMNQDLVVNLLRSGSDDTTAPNSL